MYGGAAGGIGFVILLNPDRDIPWTPDLYWANRVAALVGFWKGAALVGHELAEPRNVMETGGFFISARSSIPRWGLSGAVEVRGLPGTEHETDPPYSEGTLDLTFDLIRDPLHATAIPFIAVTGRVVTVNRDDINPRTALSHQLMFGVRIGPPLVAPHDGGA